MAKEQYLVHLDLTQYELQNAVIQNLATAPSTPKNGQIYYDTNTLNKFRGFVGGSWKNFLTTADSVIYSIAVNNGKGTISSKTGSLTDPVITFDLDYIGLNNFILEATDAEGTPISTLDSIIYSDDTDGNVKKGLISDLPFDPAGTDNSTDVTLNSKVQDVLNLNSQEISAVDFNTDAIAGYDNTAEKFTYLSPSIVRNILNIEEGANNYVFTLGTTGSTDKNVEKDNKVNVTTSVVTSGSTPIMSSLIKSGTTLTLDIKLNFVNNDDLATATATNIASALSVKNYVDGVLTGALIYIGGYDASTDSPSLDDGTPIAGIKKGWTYTVTNNGLFFEEAVQAGDMIIAEQDNPTSLAHWTVVNKNIPDILNASETQKGVVEEATDAEVTSGASTGSSGAKLFVTPEKLKTHLGLPGNNNSVSRKFITTCGATTSTTVTHNLGSKFVNVEIFNTTTGQRVVAAVECLNTTSLKVSFNTAPTAGQYTIVVVG